MKPRNTDTIRRETRDPKRAASGPKSKRATLARKHERRAKHARQGR